MDEHPKHLSCVETARLVRPALKRAFPGVKFSVRSSTYAGGASIHIRWTDGPTEKAVRDVTGDYTGGDFDGSIDLQYHNSSWLMPDGTATPARSAGTEGSRGCHPGYDNEKPHPDAVAVYLGADFIFGERGFTVDRECVGRDLCAIQNVEFVGLNTRELCGNGDRQYLDDHVRWLLQRTTFAPGAVYAGVEHTPGSLDPQAWCGIITHDGAGTITRPTGTELTLCQRCVNEAGCRTRSGGGAIVVDDDGEPVTEADLDECAMFGSR